MLWLEEAHSQQNQLGLNDFGLALLYHDGASTLWVGLPFNLLNFYASEMAILSQELQGIDVPAACATFFVARGGLEGARPVGPWVLWVLRTFNGLRHNLNLSHALATLTVGSTNTVRTSITTTNHKYILALGCYAFVFRELHTSEDAILLRQHLEGEVNTFQLSAWGLEVAGGGSASGDDDAIVIAG
jgi:hypothetical protein